MHTMHTRQKGNDPMHHCYLNDAANFFFPLILSFSFALLLSLLSLFSLCVCVSILFYLVQFLNLHSFGAEKKVKQNGK